MKKIVKQIKKTMTIIHRGVCFKVNNAIVPNVCLAAHAIIQLRTRTCQFMVICSFLCIGVYGLDVESQQGFVKEE